jgi:hypothetical protein
MLGDIAKFSPDSRRALEGVIVNFLGVFQPIAPSQVSASANSARRRSAEVVVTVSITHAHSYELAKRLLDAIAKKLPPFSDGHIIPGFPIISVPTVVFDPTIKYSWIATPWGACTTTCGGGLRTRDLLCGAYSSRQIQPTYFVSDMICAAATLVKPRTHLAIPLDFACNRL